MTNKKLSVGEKYLTVKLVGHDFVTAFPNKERTGNQPHFKGDGIAIWVRTKQEPKQEVQEEQI